MKGRTSYVAVALASFAVGVAVDRILVRPLEVTARPGPDETSRERGSPALRSSDASRQSRSGSSPSPSSRAGRDRRAPESEGDGIGSEVRLVLEELDRDGRMEAATARELLERMPDGQARREVLRRIAHHWGRGDPEAALHWAAELTGQERWEAMEIVLHRWSESDPAAAATYAAALPNSERSLRLVRDMARRWAERDRVAAVEWGLAQGDAATRERALAGVVEWWGQHEPAEAAAFAAELGNVSDRREVLNAAARQWAETSVADALDWARGLPQGDREHAGSAILRHAAESDPVRAASLYAEMEEATEPGDAQLLRQMAREIAWVWSSSDPAAAAAWAVQLPEEGEVRRTAVGDVAEHWLRLDSMAAGEWIRDLPEGRTRDAATERLVRNIVESDPVSAFAWANSTSDDGHRFGMMRDVLSRWRTADPAAARAAYETAELPPEQHRHLGEALGFQSSVPASPGAE